MAENKRILIFSHRSDIDGMGPIVLSKLAFDEVIYYLCEKSDIAEHITTSGKTGELYEADYVFVTDIAITEKELNLLNDERIQGKVRVFDHHKASLEIDTTKYPFVTARFEDEKGKCSGTSLFYEYLLSKQYLNKTAVVEDFVELIRRYDTWEWKQYQDETPRDLTLLFECLGPDKFIETFTHKLTGDSQNFLIKFSDEEMALINYKKKDIAHKVEQYAKQIIQLEIADTKVGVVFSAYEYRNEIADYLKQIDYDIDIVMLASIDKGTYSLRPIKDGADIEPVAKHIGDGAQAVTASGPITKETFGKMARVLTRIPFE